MATSKRRPQSIETPAPQNAAGVRRAQPSQPPATRSTKATKTTVAKATVSKTTATRAKTARASGARSGRARPKDAFDTKIASPKSAELTVRRMHRRDINRVWEFIKLSFRDVNRETVEYQRPRSKERFVETYDDEGVEQLVFETGDEVVGYAECAYEVTGSDNWINPRYFESRDMRPLFVEELATHPEYTGRGVGGFMLEQLEHLARMHGCTHLVLEVAENNENALAFYRRRTFYKLDAAIFLAKKLEREPDLLPPRKLKPARPDPDESQ